MEHVENLTDYEKLKKAEMAVVSVGVFDWNTHGDSLGSEL